MFTRRAIALAVSLAAAPAAAPDRVVAVCRCQVQAYADAVEGVRAALGRHPEVVDLGAVTAPALAARVADPGKAYIAVGREALHALAQAKAAGPVVAAMMLRRDAAAEGVALAGEVDLDLPPRALLAELRRLFPKKSRLGILASANSGAAELAAAARETEFSTVTVEVRGPSELLRAFASLEGRADLVVALPDGAIFNSATIKPLILASIGRQLPVIGFSAAFVRAGAAAGVFIDFRESGRRAAEAALRADVGLAQTGAPAMKPRVMVNQRVLRLLGMKYERGGDVETLEQ
jgi:putative tryptophan/tyrosine transport system substrate-binding protein